MDTADNHTIFMCRLSINSGSLNLLEPSGLVETCDGIASPFISGNTKEGIKIKYKGENLELKY